MRSVFRQSGVALALLDRSGAIVDMNPAAERAFGLRLGEAAGRALWLAPHLAAAADCAGRLRELIAGAADGRQDRCAGELTIESATRSFDFRVAPLRPREGQPCHLLLEAVDTTSQRAMEAELSLASLIYQNSAESMIVTDAANRILAVNPAFTRTTGYTFEEVVGQNPRMFRSGLQDRDFYDGLWQSLQSEGQWQGEIWNRRKDGTLLAEWLSIRVIRDASHRPLRHVALFSDITEKKRADQIIWEQSNFDPLTRLPNRRLFQDRLQQELRRAERGGEGLALLTLGLDRFSEVNAALGRDLGDQVLVATAARLRAMPHDLEALARVGGDQFSVLLPRLADPSQAQETAQRVSELFERPFDIGAERIYVTASIGVALFPSDAQTAEQLSGNADHAMFVSKRGGCNRLGFFSEATHAAARGRVRLTNHLRDAAGAGQLRLDFQPITRMSDGAVVKAEALLRWQHPEHGLMPPAQFIPLAEDAGLIHEIGDWAFREALLWAVHWSRLVDRPFQVGVNVSPAQFAVAGGLQRWPYALRAARAPAGCMAVEITERVLLESGPAVLQQLQALKAAGIEVAIDDFGTGYSSLAYLTRFPIDYLKIDQSFVRGVADDANDQAVAEAIIMMAHRLGQRVIAEGVETGAQWQLLHAAGCDYAQGYLVAQPLGPEEFERFLLRPRRRP